MSAKMFFFHKNAVFAKKVIPAPRNVNLIGICRNGGNGAENTKKTIGFCRVCAMGPKIADFTQKD